MREIGHLFDVPLEKSVLGKLITDPTFAGLAIDTSPTVFSVTFHVRVFIAIVRLHNEGNPITRMSVYSLLADLEQTDESTITRLVDLEDNAISAYDFEFCINRIRNLSIHRNTLADLDAAVERLAKPGAGIEDVRQVEEIARNADSKASTVARLRTVKEIVSEYPGGVNAFLRPFQGQDYVRLPWFKARKIMGGVWPGEVLVLGGRPGSGKSAAALQLARHNAQFGMTPALFNLEMSDQQTIYRTICARAGVAMSRFRMGETNEDEEKAIYAELCRFGVEKMLLCDRSSLSIGQIRQSLRKHIRSHGVNMAIIDYLQLAEPGVKTDNRQQEVAYISRQCKTMAMEFKIPMIVLAQLSRKSEEQNREPVLSDMRESGAIEQDADVVMFTHRKTELVAGMERHSYALIFPKVRNGEIGRCNVQWNGRALEFADFASEAENG